MTDRTRALARIGILSVACLLVGQVAAAQGFWASKEYTQWSDDELKKFVSDSPWVKKYEWVRSTGPATSDFFDLFFAWESSLPVRWSNLRTRMGKPGEAPADAKQTLDQVPEVYAIRLSGLPADVITALQATQNAAAGTVLKIGKREIPIKQMVFAAAAPAAGAGGRGGAGGGRGGGRGGAGVNVYLMFPRDTPIKVEENEVEVIAKFGSLKLSPKAFKLKDMVVNGKLEL